MIEKTVLDHLLSKLDVPVYTEYPKDPDERFVLIEKTGGGCTNMLYSAAFIIQSYGTSMYDSAMLDNEVQIAMMDIVELADVTRCSLNSSCSFNDTANKRYRYQSVFDLNYYQGGKNG